MYQAAQYFTSENANISMLNEQQQFLEILHQDTKARNGYVVRFTMNGKKQNYWTTDIQNITTADQKHNTYVSLNSFNGPSRRAENVRTINCIYLDLDCHEGYSIAEINARVQNTQQALRKAYEDGKLPRPTMITESGRGLGVFYVLERSIANTSKTQKQIKFWRYINKELASLYQLALIKHENVLEVDTQVVGDASRVVRLPLTKNQKADKLCRLSYVGEGYFGETLYYNLSDFKPYLKDYNVYEKTYQEVKKEIVRAQIVDFEAYSQGYLLARINKLLRAQSVLKDMKEGCRELLCFLYYNTMKQIVSAEEAQQRLYQYNQGFTYPLTDQREIDNIIIAVNRNKAPDGSYTGYYKISDKTIVSKLDLKKKVTPEQFNYIGFGRSMKETRRAEKKEANKQKREQRDQEVVSYITEHPEVTYDEIAIVFGVSVRTIKNIAKQHEIKRYQKEATVTSICATKNQEEATTEKNESRNSETEKNQKCKNLPQSLYTAVCALQRPIYNNTTVSKYNIYTLNTLMIRGMGELKEQLSLDFDGEFDAGYG